MCRTVLTQPPASHGPGRWHTKARILLLVAFLLIGSVVGCQLESPFQFKTDQIRLLFNAFPGRSFGTSTQTPVLVVSEVTGKLRGKACLLLQVSYASTEQIVLQPNKGSILSTTDADLSDAAFKKYQECNQQKRSCLIGVLSLKQPELIAQVELLSPTAGGLLIGALYQGDCSSEDTFDSSNILARQALAIGREFQSTNTETTTSSTEPTSTETVTETTADGGTSE